MPVPVLAIIGIASAVYSIWESHQQTPEQREASRGRHRAMFWGGLAGAFAAGTPAVAGMGKFGGYAGAAGGAGGGAAAGTTEAAVETTAATAGTEAATGGTQAAGAVAATDFTPSMSTAAGSGAPWQVKAAYWSGKVQSAFESGGGTWQNMAMQFGQQALAPRPADPIQMPPQQRPSPIDFQQYYDDDHMAMAMQEDILSDDTRRGALRHTWWEE